MTDAAPIRFDGEVAVVTGAGAGLGRSYVRLLAARGASVVCNDFVPARADAIAQEIVDDGGSAVGDSNSVATPAGGEAIVRTALDAFGSVEIVVNNAGQIRNAAFEHMPVEHFREVVETHLAGAFYVTQPAYRHMKDAGYGRIIFTSSNAGAFGLPWQANYGAAKAGLLGLCNVVALEGAPYGISANAVMPMALDTSMQQPDDSPAYSREGVRNLMDAFEGLAPHLLADRVAPLVAYLASRRCHETGRIFSVGAGHVSRVFIGASRGWYSPGLGSFTPEQVEAALDEASDLDGFAVPDSAYDEFRFIKEHLPRTADSP
jgi:NAD(P)-dependent dehydrogenase (short-subunit alcohol dehydrogenase family)